MHPGFPFTASQLDQGDQSCAPHSVGLGSLSLVSLFGWLVLFFDFGLSVRSRHRDKGQMQPHVMMKTEKYVNTPPPDSKLGHVDKYL